MRKMWCPWRKVGERRKFEGEGSLANMLPMLQLPFHSHRQPAAINLSLLPFTDEGMEGGRGGFSVGCPRSRRQQQAVSSQGSLAPEAIVFLSLPDISPLLEILYTGVLPSQCSLGRSLFPSGSDLLLGKLPCRQGGKSGHPPYLSLGVLLGTHRSHQGV